MMNITPCTCVAPGFCPRHKTHRNQRKWEWCQKQPEYRRQWDETIAKIAEQNGTEPPDIQKLYQERFGAEETVQTDPSFGRKVFNFADSMKDVGRHFVQTGKLNIDNESYKKRLEICHACPSNLYDEKTGRCRHIKCGCSLAKKAKLVATNCPMNHWKDNGV